MGRDERQNEQMRHRATEAILQAALRLFAERGFHAATTTEIASQAGVSRGLIHHYFRSKDDLLLAIVERHLHANLDALRSIPDEDGAAGRLRTLMEKWLHLAISKDHSHRLYLLLLLQPAASEAVARAAEKLKPQAMESLGAVKQLFSDLGSEEAAADAGAFVAALNGLALLLAIQPALAETDEDFPLAAIKARMLDLFAPEAIR